MNQVEQDIKAITSTIVDAEHKPHLRSTLMVTLVRDFEHSFVDAGAALDKFFDSATVH